MGRGFHRPIASYNGLGPPMFRCNPHMIPHPIHVPPEKTRAMGKRPPNMISARPPRASLSPRRSAKGALGRPRPHRRPRAPGQMTKKQPRQRQSPQRRQASGHLPDMLANICQILPGSPCLVPKPYPFVVRVLRQGGLCVVLGKGPLQSPRNIVPALCSTSASVALPCRPLEGVCDTKPPSKPPFNATDTYLSRASAKEAQHPWQNWRNFPRTLGLSLQIWRIPSRRHGGEWTTRPPAQPNPRRPGGTCTMTLGCDSQCAK